MPKIIPFRYDSLKTLLGDIGDGVLITDEDEIIRYGNEAAWRILGYNLPEGDMPDVMFSDVCPLVNLITKEPYPDPLPIAMRGLTSVGLGKDVGLIKNGKVICLSATCSPMRTPTGRLLGASVILRDVTQIRMLERKVETDQRYMTNVFSAARIGLCVLDYRGITRKINSAGLEMMQATEEMVIGCQFGDGFMCVNSMEHGCGKGSFCGRCPVRRNINLAMMDDDYSNDFTFVMQTKRSLTPLWLKVFISQMGQGEDKKIILALIDISARKLYERQLKDAKTVAEAANEAKTLFISNISHEIRTPVNGMMGMLELAMRESLPTSVHEYLVNAKTCAEDLLSIINDILDFSKLESGRMTLEDIGFDLHELLGRMDAVYKQLAEKKGLYMRVDGMNGVPRYVKGDPLRVRQIFRNLLTNALKFTSHGGIEIKASVGEWDGKPFLRFAVVDTGIGMDIATQERLFQPFTQGDASTTRKYGGTGLGLMIVRELVNAMGGDIVVESKLGVGSQFIFRLPLRLADGAEHEMRDQTVFLNPLTAEQKIEAKKSEDSKEAQIDITDLLKYCNEKLTGGDEK